MLKLQFEIGCVLCNKPVSNWTIILTDKHRRFYTKCSSCEAMNTFSISNRIDINRVPLYLEEMSVKSKMDIKEIERINDTRKRYNIPEHVPVQQTYKYAKVKLNKQVEEERVKWGLDD